MKWDELKMPARYVLKNYIETDVECPNCGAKLHKRTDIVLTSDPPKHYYTCPECKWTGINY